MIADLLENANLYSHINDRLALGLNYLKNTDLSKLELGKHVIKEDKVFALVSEYNSKNPEDAKWEAHEKYADIQFLVSGEEKMGYAPLNTMQVSEVYNPDKDIMFLKGTGDYITVKPGTFLVFFPKDAHQPCVAIKGNVPVRKVVVKVMM